LCQLLKAAFLFGSAARGTARIDSDIDVAVVLEGISNSFDAQVELMKLRRVVDLRIEPHPFAFQDEDDPSGFMAEIRKSEGPGFGSRKGDSMRDMGMQITRSAIRTAFELSTEADLS
jgi:hypothetical protein